MDPMHHQGEFGEAFVRLLATAAGLTVAKPIPDVAGDDFTLGYKGELAGKRSPKIDVQVKSWRSSTTKIRGNSWNYRLPREQFNQLAGANSIPKYLILVIVPDTWHAYASSTTEAMTVKHCAYWTSLADMQPAPPESGGTVSVSIPVDNVVTTETLLELMASRIDGCGR